MKLIRKLLTLLAGPRTVDAVISDLNAAVEELNQTAKVQQDRASSLFQTASDCQAEASRAARVAERISLLVS